MPEQIDKLNDLRPLLERNFKGLYFLLKDPTKDRF